MNEIQSIIDEFAMNKAQIKVLEAGCGSISKVEFPPNAYIVGIDISEKQLQRNTIVNEKISGDIQYYSFGPQSFDIIISWYVLEHLSEPKLALKNFSKAIKKDGLIILAMPNVLSLKGLITKFTPHWFHVFVYKYFFGRENAGKDDVEPFKTYLRFSLALSSLKRFAAKNGFRIEYFSNPDALDRWVGSSLQKKSKIVYIFIKHFGEFLKILSFGKIGKSEIIIILKKQHENFLLTEKGMAN